MNEAPKNRAGLIAALAGALGAAGCPAHVGAPPPSGQECSSIRQPLPSSTRACTQPPALEQIIAASIAASGGDENRAATDVRRHLESRGYQNRVKEFRLESPGETGAILLTAPESLDDSGSPRQGPDRWKVGTIPLDNFVAYLRAIVGAGVGRYRTIAVTLSRDVTQGGEASLQAFADRTGCPSQVSAITHVAGGSGLRSHVFVYEFVRTASESTRPVPPAESVTDPQALVAQLGLGSCP